MVKNIDINDFDYSLPQDKIPLHPLEKRDECKLLVSAPSGKLYHRRFKEIPDLLPPGAFLVYNDTRVINARIAFHKETGASIELFLLEPVAPSDYALNFQSKKSSVWKCLVGNSKKWKDGKIFTEVQLPSSHKVRLSAKRLSGNSDGSSEIEFEWDDDITFGQLIELVGKIPIPPYLNRESEDSDIEDYQTIYARVKGSVAAPTAGLHFTPAVMENLKAHSILSSNVTLHVGAGTFRPVKSDKIGDHAMHAEPFSVSSQLIDKLIEWKSEGKTVVAVGTTSVRTLESLPYIGHALEQGKENPFIVDQWSPYNGEQFDTGSALRAIREFMDKNRVESISASTSIMIAPEFHWRITDAMVTNFHQPKSTLLLLVSSFLGQKNWKTIYEEALKHDYRFLSYGDSCLLIR